MKQKVFHKRQFGKHYKNPNLWQMSIKASSDSKNK